MPVLGQFSGHILQPLTLKFSLDLRLKIFNDVFCFENYFPLQSAVSLVVYDHLSNVC